ncbi:MAG: DUF2914 domain-containing protein [Patescibacteria group bacterium]|nr:DUF2914 domain-containing protein [Patescibacteria group bacterium]MDE2116501.1 DUF2914 domain-containing protein [Patescibacteria group bacterium]
MLDRVREFFHKYERYVSPVTLVFGFTFDNLTLRRIDTLYSNFLLISYLIISAGSILLLNIHVTRRTRQARERSETIHAIFVFLMQFCLGGLFSASFLFYSRSGSILSSWPFLLMLVGYIIGNEVLRKNYIRLGFQISVFFTALFSFLIFFLPVILGKIGDDIFLLSGVASLMITGVFIYVLSWVATERTRKSGPILFLAIGGLFSLINILYFTDLIPPIPLALKEVGIYRSLSRLPDGTYETLGEPQQWFTLFAPQPVVHYVSGQPLFAFSAIFAPANLNTDIIHEWQMYDPTTHVWKTFGKIDLGISGGRALGYRTYSEEPSIQPGLWRVNVETPRGQILGSMVFTVEPPSDGEKLITSIK